MSEDNSAGGNSSSEDEDAQKERSCAEGLCSGGAWSLTLYSVD